MISTSFVQLELRADGILALTINRPAQYNALNIATLTELESILLEAKQQPQVRALLLTGAGDKAFVAGADINEFQQVKPEESRFFAERGQRVLQLLEDMPIPVVAAINGFALGGGCELALACHIRIACEHAQLGLPEVKLGIIPGYGGTQRLTHLVGKGKALELMLTGNPIGAEEALRIGLVNRVVPAAELLSVSIKLLQQMLERAPRALRGVLQAVAATQQGSLQDGYTAEAVAFEACCQTQDFREGVQAFLEKRPARFSSQ
ncbi:enoyl-CoA hydratase/isomerase family protein [Hymenobacter psychrotolerans]|uniref:Enoyl-CoA hydratase n=1 Tax=Hymenobacter psychrotolerans DSM 18569 TaxID=1121959 RepID=A0A1M7BG14_9BACT|nr:enoyl-CoA hydratase-related protein [Hymenobacter psychrotolerans]SHL53874.1 enoyl-CoA hydratase [Hymenobacter psychrotolerans DSM 18569]